MILYTAADLVWATRIKAAAEDLRIPARPVRSPRMLADRLADSDPNALIVDLEAEHAVEIISAAAEARAERPLRIVAFGPHADTERLGAAGEAGADRVLPRGALATNLPRILADLARPDPR